MKSAVERAIILENKLTQLPDKIRMTKVQGDLMPEIIKHEQISSFLCLFYPQPTNGTKDQEKWMGEGKYFDSDMELLQNELNFKNWQFAKKYRTILRQKSVYQKTFVGMIG